MAKTPKADSKATAPKKTKAEVDPALISSMKVELKDKCVALDPANLDATAKRFGVDVKAYAKLQGGLRKMSTINSILGSAARWMREDGKSKKDVLALAK